MKKNVIKIGSLILLLMILIALWAITNSISKNLSKNSELQKGEVVAIVNGTNIYKQDFDLLYDSAASSLQVDPKFLGEQDLLEFKTEIIEYLINEEIIKAETKKANIEVTDEMIDNELKNIVESVGGEEEFENVLVENNLTKETLIKQIETELLSQEYLKFVTKDLDIQVTDEEINSIYASVADPNNPDIPELAEVRDDIVEMVKEQKKLDAYYQNLATLRENAEIENFIK